MPGYSGVVIYTRSATCAPIRAEEGITGILTPPNSSTSFRDLPDEEQIGGYPNADQLSQADYDPATLDCEGRCVILEFPAFVLIGTYCPAERDETRTLFRTSFLRVLDSRIRNLVKMGKRVIWTGDLNISREEIDTAAAEETMRKNEVTAIEWISTPARRMFNQLLVGGKVHGERDEGRETPIMWDICRAFHPGRKGMYTCWETKVNARPGNYGARIDYVVCTHDMNDWFSASDIQEGLMGSDHCPVYAVFKDKVIVNEAERHILDMINPPGMFENGLRQQHWTAKNLLPMSGRLIQEFDKRRSIRDMFTRQPSALKSTSTIQDTPEQTSIASGVIAPVELASKTAAATDINAYSKGSLSTSVSNPDAINGKRPAAATIPAPPKRTKMGSQTPINGVGKGQKSLKGFFTTKSPAPTAQVTPSPAAKPATIVDEPEALQQPTSYTKSPDTSPTKSEPFIVDEAASFETKKSWGKLFSRPIAPKCDHDEPCKTMLTKKPGANCGRSFWMCNRPLGPSGKQERGTQWRCSTFIWASDWDAHLPDPD